MRRTDAQTHRRTDTDANRRQPRVTSKLAGVALAAASTSAALARTTPPQYRVTVFIPEFTGSSCNIPNLIPRVPDFIDGVDLTLPVASAALGINEHGVVVGMARIEETVPGFGVTVPSIRPFIWQPETVYPGLGVNTMHPLPMWGTTPCSDGPQGAAFDINDAGDVVGVAEHCPAVLQNSDDFAAFVWSVDGGLGHSSATMHRLDGLPPGSAPRSCAWAISERFSGGAGPTATVAGWRIDVPGFEKPQRYDARSLSANPLPLPPPGTFLYKAGSADGINPGAGTSERIVGQASLSSIRNDVCVEEAERLPLAWNTGLLSILPFDAPPIFDGRNAFARDVNDLGVAVGFARDNAETVCVQRACYWPTPSSISLFAPDPTGPDDDTFALAINASGAAVGTNATDRLAVSWPVPTTYVDLTSVTDCLSCGLIDIRSAHDLNGAGWIVATALRECAPGEAAEVGVLLVPLGPCPADVDRDGDVDATDLALVQTSTGACPPRTICWADVNGDCRVDSADLQIVMQSLKTQDCALGETLAAPLAATWLAAGGAEFLSDHDDDAAHAVEAAYDSESQLTTFTNLLDLLEDGDAP